MNMKYFPKEEKNGVFKHDLSYLRSSREASELLVHLVSFNASNTDYNLKDIFYNKKDLA